VRHIFYRVSTTTLYFIEIFVRDGEDYCLWSIFHYFRKLKFSSKIILISSFFISGKSMNLILIIPFFWHLRVLSRPHFLLVSK
jgi:hypothetical protein